MNRLKFLRSLLAPLLLPLGCLRLRAAEPVCPRCDGRGVVPVERGHWPSDGSPYPWIPDYGASPVIEEIPCPECTSVLWPNDPGRRVYRKPFVEDYDGTRVLVAEAVRKHFK